MMPDPIVLRAELANRRDRRIVVAVLIALAIAAVLLVWSRRREMSFDSHLWKSSSARRWQMVKAAEMICTQQNLTATQVLDRFGDGDRDPFVRSEFAALRGGYIAYKLPTPVFDNRSYWFEIIFDEQGRAVSSYIESESDD